MAKNPSMSEAGYSRQWVASHRRNKAGNTDIEYVNSQFIPLQTLFCYSDNH